ncbi:ATP-binding protein [Alcaligenes sp. SORT26]|uniref:NACHT domain-containing protein n=1 Tax=Alcaligenes sp. SORT26 TaxID=2813780 RepID=UPI001A9F9406|nr:ATP-binding protein [Alcaligenes sp. SORT26]QTB99413.1 ATP-binding protein [Alcaligenes sp. SORT26]
MTKSTNNKQPPQQGVGKKQATSTELTGGTGFTYEDKVVAYYLAALLRSENAMLQHGTVSSVATQQAGHGQPMDDLIVEFQDADGPRMLGLQVKSTITVSGATTNKDFRDVLNRAKETRKTPGFQVDRDAYGYVVDNVAEAKHRSLNRLIDWAVSSPTPADFDRRFAADGAAAAAERALRDELAPLIGACSAEDGWKFYRQFVAARFSGLEETGIFWAEITNRLQELVASNEDGLEVLLFDRLCRIVRDGTGTARKWTRAALLAQLRGVVRLKISPSFRSDIDTLVQFSRDGLNEIAESIDGFEVDRAVLQQAVHDRLAASRVVNISGLPGCGKSVVLKRVATEAAQRGPILFLKSDRLTGKSWLEFAAALGVKHRKLGDILAEMGAAGTATLYIDGIDRITPDQKRIILDILNAIEANPDLSNWQVLATSRDQGLETYRAWFPSTFYSGTQIGDVQVEPFNDDEAKVLAKEKPGLHHLLMGAPSVKAIARRPFFAAVLARSFSNETTEPQTEVDLINAWWARAGHDAAAEVVPQRQRALLDIAEKGVTNLGKNVAARSLAEPTFMHIAALKSDLLLRGNNGDASFSFSHDIFFEWTFFRLLIDLGDTWIEGLAHAGEPPLLGRVVGLLAQHSIAEAGQWSASYVALDQSTLRPQWRREWLTAPPFTSTFLNSQKEFTELVATNDYVLLEKLLVWFQAQHTIPSPTVLAQTSPGQSGLDQVSLAELLSWPSDFTSWGRFLDWLLPLAATLPVRLLPRVVEVFSVWQNALSDFCTARSKAIVAICAEWLIDFEQTAYSEKQVFERSRWDELGRDAKTQFATALRIVIVRAARAFPEYANTLFERATVNERMRRDAYSDLMALAWMMAEVSPERLAAVTKAELQQELPQDHLDREKRERREAAEWIQRIRDKPETERTEHERRMLEHIPFHIPHSYGGLGREEIGIDRHHNFYSPVSAMHEPFASLFNKKPEVALQLVHDLANHGTTGWRQIANITRLQHGTPIPTEITFPWGKQQFWGDWSTYNWQLGQLGAQPLDCAFLAMSYWAFHQIESGRPVDEVIQLIVQGNEAIAAPGLALRLALETSHISEVTLALVTCQRLWPFDIERVRQEPTRNIDLFGFGIFNRLTGVKKAAQDYLDKRPSRFRDIKQLAMQFAINGNAEITERFKQALASFVTALPYQLEEQRSNPASTATLTKQAEEYAALAVVDNYQGYRTPDNRTMIAYHPPLSQEAITRGEAAGVYLQQNGVLTWAVKSLRAFAIDTDKTLMDAVALARPLDHPTLFAERLDVENHTPQSLVAAVAACVICFSPPLSENYKWAIDVMARIEGMKEPAGFSYGSKIAWHPVLQLIFALLHLRRNNPSNLEPARRLIWLTAHPHEEAADCAFSALLADPDPHVSWVIAQLVLERAHYYQPVISGDGERDNRTAKLATQAALDRALKGLKSREFGAFGPMPPAWVKLPSASDDKDDADNKGRWTEPDPLFDPRRAEKHLGDFPIEKWCTSDETKPLVLALVKSLVNWTILRMNPPKGMEQRRDCASDLIGWDNALGDVLARAAPFFDLAVIEGQLLAPFLQNHDNNSLNVIAAFTDRLVTRHVLDATKIPAGTFELLGLCADHVISDSTFRPGGYRAGEVSGREMPKLIEALLIVNVERATGAARFVNGDWSEISLVMPTVTRLVTATGWSAFVMSKFLLLCERAGRAYPLDHFIEQASAVLTQLDSARGNWVGTSLPARTAAVVQQLADANFPLRPDQAQGLLWILDALIDLGDRRSAALEQTEAFKSVQARSQIR